MIFLLLLFFHACDRVSETSCVNSTDCALDAVCRDEHCVRVDCLDSSDCNWSESCDLGSCLPGCQLNSDCMAGLECDAGECVPAPCNDTQIDCAFGQYCTDGGCVNSTVPVCEHCDYEDWELGLPDARECVTYRFFADQSCSLLVGNACDDGLSCFPNMGDLNMGTCVELFAFSYCGSDQDCPQGFHCWRDIYGPGSGVSVCESNCNSYLDLETVGQ